MGSVYFLQLVLRFSWLLTSVSGFLIEKELGTGKNIDVREDENYKLLPSLEKCGISTENIRVKRVVGGKPFSSTQYPWMAQIYALNVSTDNSIFNCGGSFITENVILTAGHCISRIISGTSLVEIGFGKSDRRKLKICSWDPTLRKKQKCSKKFTRLIERSVVHENYSEGNLHNDLGLIFLDKPVKFSSNVRPICLPYSEELLKSWDDTKLDATGWGFFQKYDAPGPRTASELAMEVGIHVRERKYCNTFHTRQYGKLTKDRFCGGGDPGHGICSGDSGSPLSKKLPVPHLDGQERTFQLGLVSSGTPAQCGYQGRPMIFTNVLYYMPWILENVFKNVSVDSVESFSAEIISELDSSEDSFDSSSSSELDIPINTFKNELSTGFNIDVMAHKNFDKLPHDKCGTVLLPGAIPKKPKDDDEDDDEEEEAVRAKRLVGGRVLQMGKFPFMAQIYVKDASSDESDLRCGGMIISQRAIITAARCIVDIPPPFVLDYVEVGNFNRNKSEECINGECFKAQIIPIVNIVIHEEFTKFAMDNNIAIIKLSEDLKFNRVIQPVCLPTSESMAESLTDMKMITAGWGRLVRSKNDSQKDTGKSNIPQHLEVSLRPRSDCDRLYTRIIGNSDRSRLCGGGETTAGECSGDTGYCNQRNYVIDFDMIQGGPLMKQISDVTAEGKKITKYVQFGIISFTECGQQGLPTVYINVLYYMPWILDNL